MRAQECSDSVAAHRRSSIDIRHNCTTDTFDQQVSWLSEVGTIAPASAVTPLATALPSAGLPSLTLTSSALHDGAHSHSLTAVSARGVAGGYRVMQHDRDLAPAACLFSTLVPWLTRALDLCATGGVEGASGPHSGTE